MVRESLNNFINKYPYFLTREPSSVFYRTSSVNNRQIQKLYCELFNVYQSFHLEKRILLWKEQVKPYDYNINFVANYTDLKNIKIFKNDNLIKEVSFEEEGTDNFEWTYVGRYVEKNIYELKSYKCSECGTIYFDDNIPITCQCGNDQYIPLSVYSCTECGEVYFVETLNEEVNRSDCTRNNHIGTLEEVQIYKCKNCGETYFTNDIVKKCVNCSVEENNNLGEYHIKGVLKDDWDEQYSLEVTVKVYDDENNLVDTVLLNPSNNWEAYTTPLPIKNLMGDLIDYNILYTNHNFNVILNEYTKHGTPNSEEITSKIYYNDLSIEFLDNSETIEEEFKYNFLTYEEYLYLKNNGTLHILARRNSNLAEGETIKTVDENTSLILNPNVEINTFDVDIINQNTGKKVDTITLTPLRVSDNGSIIFSPSNDWLFPTQPTWETYSKELPLYDNTGELIPYTLQYDNTYFDVQIKDKTPLLKDYTLSYEEIINSNKIYGVKNLDSGEEFELEIPIIPTDQFRMIVTTYEEYVIEKGFPENDYTLLEYNRALAEKRLEPNIYDHDYSLDEIGALNNIPRKEYVIIDDPLLYPRTEPSYNNRSTEDDYHYMKRMLEYNTRQWTMNPVSLELWKMYGVESELINRERYLLKVFDEQLHPFNNETELVECWSPRAWEHKDRFCDGSKSLGEYFFVYASNVQPIVDEDVTCNFHIINSIGEELPYNDYTINIDKIITEADKLTDEARTNKLYSEYNVGDIYPLATDIRDINYIIESEYLSEEKDPSTNQATNIFSFKCYKPNGEQLGYDYKKSEEENEKYNRNYIVINVRDYYDSDWFVDPKPYKYLDEEGDVISNYKGKGTIDEPFLTFEEAINKVTPGLNLIGLGNNIILKKPVLVDKSCTIIGKDNYILTSTSNGTANKRQVPRIFQHNVEKVNDTLLYNRRFFHITGGKNNSLILSNLRLVSGEINNYVNINTWQNNNPTENHLFTVYVHGGGVLMTILLDENTYYPYDFISGTLKLTKSDGVSILPNNTIEEYYNGEKINTYTTDSNGEVHFLFHLNEFEQDVYMLVFRNRSTTFFESEFTQNINATNPFTAPKFYIYQGETINLTSSNHETTEGEVKFFNNIDGLLNIKEVDSEGASTLSNYKPLFGRYIIYTTYDNELESRVRDEWYVESKCDLSKLYDYLQAEHHTVNLIKDLEFDNNRGVFEYDTVALTSNMKLGDLEGVVIDVEMEGDNLVIEKFHAPLTMTNDTIVTYTDAKELEKALLDINLTEGGVLTTTRVGEFWRRQASALTLTSPNTTVKYQSTLTINGALSVDTDVEEDIDVYIDNVYSETVKTDTDGEFTYTNDTLNMGEHNIKFQWAGDLTYDSCNSVMQVNIINSNAITLSSNKSTVFIPNTFTVSGTATKNDVVLSDRTVEIYNADVLVGTATTDSEGNYSLDISTGNNPVNYHLVAKLVDEEYDDIVSNTVIVTARRLNTSISISAPSVTYSQNATVSGVVTDELGGKCPNVYVNLTQDGYDVGRVATDSNGAYSFSIPTNSSGSHTLVVTTEVSWSYSPTSNITSLTVNKAPVSVNVENSKSTYKFGETIPISVTSSYGNVNPSSVTVYYYTYTPSLGGYEISTVLTNKGSDGKFQYQIPSVLMIGDINYATGSHNISARYGGDENYNTGASQTKSIEVVNDSFNTIVLSLVNNHLRMTFKDGANPVKNKSISQIKLYLTINNMQLGVIVIENKVTDSNGNIDYVDLTIQPNSVDGTAYVVCDDITSNTLTF